MNEVDTLLARFRQHDATAAVIGMGYVGLPLALEIARAGFRVVGVDLDPRKVEAINAGRSYIGDISDAELQQAVQSGRLKATTRMEDIDACDAVSICVPTPLGKTRDPDISYIIAATEKIQALVLKNRARPMLVVLESTTYPGTTVEIILPRLAAAGAQVGKDFFLAFSPERVDPGNKNYGVRNTPKIVGGVTPACGQMARTYYEQFIERVIQVSSTQAAEMVKLLENTFRSVNIGLVNEVAIMCHHLGINVWEVIDAAASKPFGFMPFFPGPGLGGHCIPIDPLYLSWKLKTLNYTARFIELAAEINSKMPNFVNFQIADLLNRDKKCLNGANVLVLGVAYKRDTADVRESPALDILRFLHAKGAHVKYSDPLIRSIDLEGMVMESVSTEKEELARQDLVIIVTDHTSFDYDHVVKHSRRVFDTRNAARNVKEHRDKITVL